MRKLAAALCAVVCTALVTSPVTEATAQAPTKKKPYVVTLKASGTPLAGSAVVLTGKVTGPGAGTAPVTIQRRHGSGAWARAATVRTTKRGAFTARVTLTAGGATQFRAVKAASKHRKAGTSRAVAMTVNKWFDLTTSPAMVLGSGFVNHPATMGGRRFSSSFQGVMNEGTPSVIAAMPAGLCSTFEFHTGFLDADKDRTDAGDRQLQLITGGPLGSETGPTLTRTFETLPGQVKRQSVSLAGIEFFYLQLAVDHQGEGTPPRGVIAAPRMLCAVDSLPGFADEFYAQIP